MIRDVRDPGCCFKNLKLSMATPARSQIQPDGVIDRLTLTLTLSLPGRAIAGFDLPGLLGCAVERRVHVEGPAQVSQRVVTLVEVQNEFRETQPGVCRIGEQLGVRLKKPNSPRHVAGVRGAIAGRVYSRFNHVETFCVGRMAAHKPAKQRIRIVCLKTVVYRGSNGAQLAVTVMKRHAPGLKHLAADVAPVESDARNPSRVSDVLERVVVQ